MRDEVYYALGLTLIVALARTLTDLIFEIIGAIFP